MNKNLRFGKVSYVTIIAVAIVWIVSFVTINAFVSDWVCDMPQSVGISELGETNYGHGASETEYKSIYANEADEEEAKHISTLSTIVALFVASVMSIITIAFLHFVVMGKACNTSGKNITALLIYMLIFIGLSAYILFGYTEFFGEPLMAKASSQNQSSDTSSDNKLIHWEGYTYEIPESSEVEEIEDEDTMQTERNIYDGDDEVAIRSFILREDIDPETAAEYMFGGQDYSAENKAINGIEGVMVSDVTTDSDGVTMYRKTYLFNDYNCLYVLLAQTYEQDFPLEDYMVFKTLKEY